MMTTQYSHQQQQQQEPMEIEVNSMEIIQPKDLLTTLITTTDAFYPILDQLFNVFEEPLVFSSSSLKSSTEVNEEEKCRQVIKTLVDLSLTNKTLHQYIKNNGSIWMSLYKRVPSTTDMPLSILPMTLQTTIITLQHPKLTVQTMNNYLTSHQHRQQQQRQQKISITCDKLRKMVYMKYFLNRLLNLRGDLVNYCNLSQNMPLMRNNNGLLQVPHSLCVLVVKENYRIRQATSSDPLGVIRMMPKQYFDYGNNLEKAINGFLQNLRIPRCL